MASPSPQSYAPEPLPFDEAARLVRERVVVLADEHVPLRAAHGRVLAEEILASHPVPHFASSMMDGFAVRAADLAGASPDNPVELRLIGEIPAGSAENVALAPGTCAKIMTLMPGQQDKMVGVDYGNYTLHYLYWFSDQNDSEAFEERGWIENQTVDGEDYPIWLVLNENRKDVTILRCSGQ